MEGIIALVLVAAAGWLILKRVRQLESEPPSAESEAPEDGFSRDGGFDSFSDREARGPDPTSSTVFSDGASLGRHGAEIDEMGMQALALPMNEGSDLPFGASIKLQIENNMYQLVDRQTVVTWDLAEGLRVLLVVDFGGSERNVTPKQMKRWGKSREEIWETALLSSAQHAASALEAFDLSREDGSGQLLQLMSSPSNFTAVMGLRVSKDLAADGISVVLGLPSWCNVLLRQLDGTARRSDIEKMAAMVASTYDQAATPGVPGLFWHRVGTDGTCTYIKLDFATEGDEQSLEPRLIGPAELLSILATD